MITIIALLLTVTAFGLVGAWFGENPGEISVIWQGYKIETSVEILLLIIFISALLLVILYRFCSELWNFPGNIRNRRTIKNYQLALNSLTKTVAALASSDIDSAANHTKSIEKSLGASPLTLMLRAQISKSAGNDNETRILLEKLLEYPETEYLAATSLSDAAHKQKLLPDALNFAKRAYLAKTNHAAGAWKLLSAYIEDGKFQEAEIHTETARKNRAFSRADLKKAKGEIALKQAKNELAANRIENATLLAKKAKKFLGKTQEIDDLYNSLQSKQTSYA